MIRDSSSLMIDEGRRGVGSDSRLIPTRHRDRVERGDRHEQAVAIASINWSGARDIRKQEPNDVIAAYIRPRSATQRERVRWCGRIRRMARDLQ
jgi:hypothetical protein